ncbi:hypothetical protein KIW84_024778 [Lathyrus oleraceus]|uniref:Uncharacterized protein n=1 Tax=Pisum sativum TaxID=3888 RepID=A0A9D5BD21_PEA|nr:hypothetical protein KIW84_024778 [Pisum sativum]
MCTSTLPASRPSMKEVLKILIGCRDPFGFTVRRLMNRLFYKISIDLSFDLLQWRSIVAEILQPELWAAAARRNAELAWL